MTACRVSRASSAHIATIRSHCETLTDISLIMLRSLSSWCDATTRATSKRDSSGRADEGGGIWFASADVQYGYAWGWDANAFWPIRKAIIRWFADSNSSRSDRHHGRRAVVTDPIRGERGDVARRGADD